MLHLGSCRRLLRNGAQELVRRLMGPQRSAQLVFVVAGFGADCREPGRKRHRRAVVHELVRELHRRGVGNSCDTGSWWTYHGARDQVCRQHHEGIRDVSVNRHLLPAFGRAFPHAHHACIPRRCINRIGCDMALLPARHALLAYVQPQETRPSNGLAVLLCRGTASRISRLRPGRPCTRTITTVAYQRAVLSRPSHAWWKPIQQPYVAHTRITIGWWCFVIACAITVVEYAEHRAQPAITYRCFRKPIELVLIVLDWTEIFMNTHEPLI